MAENENQNDLGPVIRGGYSVPPPRSRFVKVLHAKLRRELESLLQTGVETTSSPRRRGVGHTLGRILLRYWRVSAAVAVCIIAGSLILRFGVSQTPNKDSTTPDETVTASGRLENTTRVTTVILGESRLEILRESRPEEDVERASLIVRAEVLAVGDTEPLKAGLEQTNVQFKITRVLKGELETDVISVPIAVPSPGEPAKVRYPVGKDVILFLDGASRHLGSWYDVPPKHKLDDKEQAIAAITSARPKPVAKTAMTKSLPDLARRVARASLIVRAKAVAVRDVTRVESSFVWTVFQFKVTRTLHGKLATDIIDVEIPLQRPKLHEDWCQIGEEYILFLNQKPGGGVISFIAAHREGTPPGLDNVENSIAGIIGKDPLYADAANGDYHLKSQYGRWNGSGWVNDQVTSPCIDTGDPGDDYSNEPKPDGDRINMGANGNTAEASKSASLGIGDIGDEESMRETKS